jgi:hypothetical protein
LPRYAQAASPYRRATMQRGVRAEKICAGAADFCCAEKVGG